MFLEGIGGIRIFSIDLFEEDNRIEVTFQYLNELSVEVAKEKFSLFYNENKEVVNVEDNVLNKYLKKEFNSVLRATGYNVNVPKIKVENVRFLIDETEIEFLLNKEKHKIKIEWNKVFDYMEAPAPNVPGDYVLNTVLNTEVFRSYLSYALEAKDDVSVVVSKMNLLLFFESLDQQRSFFIVQLLSGISGLFGMFNNSVFESVSYSSNIKMTPTTVLKVLMDGKLREYDFKFDYSLIIEDTSTGVFFELVKKGKPLEDNIYSFLTEINNKYFNGAFSIFKFNAKNTNKKTLKDVFIVEKGEDSFVFPIFDYENYIGNGKNIVIDIETVEFREILNSEEIFQKINQYILDCIEFMKKHSS